jgi:hypothetical protein
MKPRPLPREAARIAGATYMPAEQTLTVFASSDGGEWVNLSVGNDTFDENAFRQDWHYAVEAAYVVGDEGDAAAICDILRQNGWNISGIRTVSVRF